MSYHVLIGPPAGSIYKSVRISFAFSVVITELDLKTIDIIERSSDL